MRNLWIAIALLLIVVPAAYAQDEFEGPKAGDLELNPMIQFISSHPDEGDSNSALFGLLGIGYYFRPDFSLSASFLIGGAGESISDNLLYYVSLEPTYHFILRNKRLVPFAGVSLGMAGTESEDTSEVGFSYGAFGGLDYYLSSRVALSGRISQLFYKLDESQTASTQFLIGAKILF